MSGPLLSEVFHSLVPSHLASPMAVDAVKHIVHARPFGQAPKLTRQVPLQRLAAQLSRR